MQSQTSFYHKKQQSCSLYAVVQLSSQLTIDCEHTQGGSERRGHFLRLITLQVLIRLALYIYKHLYEIGRVMDISWSTVWHVAKNDLRLKICKCLLGRVTVIR